MTRAGTLCGVIPLLAAVGCGGYFPPPPTTRPVAAADLAGAWAYEPLGGGAEVRLDLRPDGAFLQTVTLPREGIVSSGEWSVDGTDLVLNGVLTDFDGWRAAGAARWRIIDRGEPPAGFAVLGGAADPDGWVVLRRVH